MEFSAPPAAEQGQTFRTQEDRCRACEVMDGDLPPCIHEDIRAAHERETGFPCPRREWPDRDGPVLAKLVSLAASHGMGWNKAPLFELLWRVTFQGTAPEHEQRMAHRLLAAFNDEQVCRFLFPSSAGQE